MSKFKSWLIGFVAVKLVKAAIARADVSEYAVTAADAADKYLDKRMGEKPSQAVQDEISTWLEKTVGAFTDRLGSN